jgi:hypothetical protein
MFLEPFVNIEEEELFAPKHSSQRLPHNIGRVFTNTRRRYCPIERVGLPPACLDDLIELLTKRFLRTWYDLAQPQPDDGARPRTNAQLVMRGSFGPCGSG